MINEEGPKTRVVRVRPLRDSPWPSKRIRVCAPAAAAAAPPLSTGHLNGEVGWLWNNIIDCIPSAQFVILITINITVIAHNYVIARVVGSE